MFAKAVVPRSGKFNTRTFTTKVEKSKKIFLVDGKRTPFGKFGESLKSVTPVDLAVHASKSLLAQTKLAPNKIDHVVLGNVIPSTTDTMYGARHLGLKLGCPIETPAYMVNRLCGSGIQAIVDARNLILLGDAECVLASGTENMSLAPHLLYGGRFGTKYGTLPVVDMLSDALTDKYCNTPMAITAETLSEQFGITRKDCDTFGMKSHEKAANATKNGKLSGEIAPFPLKKGHLDKDENVREVVTMGDMEKLKASFKEGGVVTPGTASGIVDGAASVLIASEDFVNKEGLTPLAEIMDWSVVGVDPKIMGIGPSPAIKKLLARTGMNLKQVDLVEINEAFAGQALSCAKDLSLDLEKLNIWGGAIAIGHPLGASGVRISLTLARQLKDTRGKFGIASACIGGGQGIALMLRNVA